jgi:sugar transferase EpsL
VLFVAIAVLVRLTQGPPVLFFQDRVGKGERTFSLVKFRTMSDARGSEGELLPDDARITPIGRVLRRLSLDELPELWNVLIGDMSLVGPRPLPTRYLSRYSPSERRRHEVRPGLTGWAQIHGRNELGWDDRLEMDVWYVDHRSPALDAKILMRTVGLVLRGTGVGGQGTMTMPELRPPTADL